MSLWAFAKYLSPCRSAVYFRLRDMKSVNLSRAARQASAKEAVLYRDQDYPEVEQYELKYRLEFRAERCRVRARYLIEKRLPGIVLRALLSGNYRASARNSLGKKILFDTDELIDMYPDIISNRLFDGINIFEKVVIFKRLSESYTDVLTQEMPPMDSIREKLAEWLERTALDRIEDTRLPTKEEFRAAAKKAFPQDQAKITSNFFDEVWKLAKIDARYRKGGRRQT